MRVITPEPSTARLDRLRRTLRLDGGDGAIHPDARDLERLLAPVLDDGYVLVLAPRLDGVDHDLRGLLVGPAGVRVMLVRRWHGQFRQRGRAWEFNARGRRGWIPCRTDPTHDARRISDQVGRWMESAMGTRMAVEGTIAFPDRTSQVELLNEPVTEVVTVDNAEEWARGLARVRRLDGRAAGRLLEAVLSA
jgi:hypothetical protein